MGIFRNRVAKDGQFPARTSLVGGCSENIPEGFEDKWQSKVLGSFVGASVVAVVVLAPLSPLNVANRGGWRTFRILGEEKDITRAGAAPGSSNSSREQAAAIPSQPAHLIQHIPPIS